MILLVTVHPSEAAQYLTKSTVQLHSTAALFIIPCHERAIHNACLLRIMLYALFLQFCCLRPSLVHVPSAAIPTAVLDSSTPQSILHVALSILVCIHCEHALVVRFVEDASHFFCTLQRHQAARRKGNHRPQPQLHTVAGEVR